MPDLIEDTDNFDSNREKLKRNVLISNDSREDRASTAATATITPGFQSLFVDQQNKGEYIGGTRKPANPRSIGVFEKNYDFANLNNKYNKKNNNNNKDNNNNAMSKDYSDYRNTPQYNRLAAAVMANSNGMSIQ